MGVGVFFGVCCGGEDFWWARSLWVFGFGKFGVDFEVF